MREMKDSGIEWIGEIPADWNLKKLKHTFTISSGTTPKSDNLEYWDGDIPWVTPADYKTEDKYVYHGRKFLSEAGLNAANLQLLPVNSIIFSKRAPIGAVAITGAKLAINQGCISCVPAIECDIRYYYFILSIYTEQFNLLGSGTTFKEISSKDFGNFTVPAPSVSVQEKLADYLDRKCSQIDAIIARQQEVIEKLKAYKLSVITEAVTKGLNPDVPMKDSGVEWIGEIPEHWEIRRIGSFARVTSSKRIFEESYVDEGVPFYRSKEITDLSKGLHVQTEIFIPEEVFEQVNEASPAPKCGDILLTSIGTIGNTWISDGRKFYYKDGNITQIEANDSFDSAYVEYCFSSNVVLEQYTRLAMGSTLLALTIIKIKKILVAFPPLDEQRKIVQYLKLKCSSIDAAIKNKENLITKLVDYKKSLIYEVVTGKKEV